MNLFLENLISASTQVGMLYVMVAAGFICDKTGLFSEETASQKRRSRFGEQPANLPHLADSYSFVQLRCRLLQAAFSDPHLFLSPPRP